MSHLRPLAAAIFLVGCPEPVPVPEPPEPPAACITISRSVLDFGVVPPDVEVRDVIRIENDCGDDYQSVELLGVTFAEEDSGFTVTRQSDTTVRSRETVFIEVVFSGSELGDFRDELVIQTDHSDVGRQVLPALANVAGPVVTVNAVETDFGQVWAGCSRTHPVRVGNVGTTDLVVTRIHSSKPATFLVDPDEDLNGALPWTVPPGQERTLKVTFEAEAEWTYEESLTVSTEGPALGEASLPLFASGVAWDRVEDVFAWQAPDNPEDSVAFPLSQTVLQRSFYARADGVDLIGHYDLDVEGSTLLVVGDAPIEDGATITAGYIAIPDDCEATR